MAELKIDGMTCEHCARSVEQVLRAVQGVEEAHVRYPDASGTVRFAGDASMADLTRAVKAVEGAGYEARVLDNGASATGAPTPDAGPSAEGGFDYDLLVIGSGAAGMAAAIRAAELDRTVAIVEGGTLGGTCVNVGCIPSKNLLAAAEHLHATRRGFPGIEAFDPAVDWKGVLRQKQALVADLRETKYADVIEAYPRIRLLRGRARFREDGAVEVHGQAVRARGVVVATGTSPWSPPVPGLDSVEALDSTSIMELGEVPASLVVLGASAVGLELGQAFARFGASVTVLELLPDILPSEDPELTPVLRSHLESEGITFHTGARPLKVDRSGSGVVVTALVNDEEVRFDADQLLVATGRRANTEGMNLAGVGVETDGRGFVEVDKGLRTSRPGVFAAGDVTGGPGFVYVAAAGGRIAAENALIGAGVGLDLSVVPRVTFTSPQYGAIGLTEDEARERGLAVQVGRLPLEHLPRAAVSHDTRGLVKIVAEEGSGRLLGLHAVAPAAGELLGEAGLALRLGVSVQELVDTLHPYLTWSEAVKLAAQMVEGDVAKLSCCA